MPKLRLSSLKHNWEKATKYSKYFITLEDYVINIIYNEFQKKPLSK